MTTTDRYTVISADCHAGGNHAQYREYLTAELRDLFDEWRGGYRNPFRDLQDDGRSRNWDDDRRIADLEADGTVAEVVFPNTVPPFFPTGVVVAPAPSPEDYRRRLEGIRAHNRWLADFVSRHPTRRAGLGQILLNDVDEAVADVQWCREHGIVGVLLPGVSPDTPWIEPLSSDAYDPLWAACQDLDMPVTHHAGGSGIPEFADTPFRNLVFMMESGFYANRAFWHLIWSGVFSRFPRLKLILTEQGTDWLPPALNRMEHFYNMMKSGRVGELGIPAEAIQDLSPVEIFRRNIWIGSSFPAPSDAQRYREWGIDRFMWGSDYPHNEATWPYSHESLRRTFHDWEQDELAAVLGGTAAHVYGFDLDALAPLAAEHGPAVDAVKVPLDEIPADATSPAFHRP
ncbi:MAG: amidohydrolase family protein [Acidimicrobiales bacterium]|nr:amidohydrolase family protein [Acidimicrobiales bacterium]